MATKTNIEWTNHTWNPWHGCTKVSPGCKFCYMYRDKNRWGQDPKNIVRSSKATFNAPLSKKFDKRLVFTCSWSDFFIKEADDWRDDAWDIIRKTPHLTYQILTKRPDRIMANLPKDWGSGWKNVWMGVSVETQEYVHRMDILREVPAHVRFVSAEPLLGYLELDLSGFDWVITGGESGKGDNWRKADLDWFRGVRDQCKDSDTHYFHKQHGGNRKIDGSWGGRLLDGVYHDGMPELSCLWCDGSGYIDRGYEGWTGRMRVCQDCGGSGDVK